MGKTSKPLLIVVTDRAMLDWPEIKKLVDQHHDVRFIDELDVDLVLGPTAHRMSEHERRWFGNAILEARRRKYPTKAGESDPEVDPE